LSTCHQIKKNFILFALSQTGKTTILEKFSELLDECEISHTGFLTREMRTAIVRQGFRVVPVGEATMKIKPFVLAHMNYTNAEHMVSKYGVDVETFDENVESLLCPKLEESTEKGEKKVVIIDEIGAMESFSKKFTDGVQKLLDDPDTIVVAAVSQTPYVQDLQNRNDCAVLEIDSKIAVREDIPGLLLEAVLPYFEDFEHEDEMKKALEPLQSLTQTTPDFQERLNPNLTFNGEESAGPQGRGGRGGRGRGRGRGRGFRGRRGGRGRGGRGRGRGTMYVPSEQNEIGSIQGQGGLQHQFQQAGQQQVTNYSQEDILGQGQGREGGQNQEGRGQDEQGGVQDSQQQQPQQQQPQQQQQQQQQHQQQQPQQQRQQQEKYDLPKKTATTTRGWWSKSIFTRKNATNESESSSCRHPRNRKR
jgi:nucleoside-triphosphatase THEP1